MTIASNAVARLRLIYRAFGAKGLARRAWYVLNVRSGVFQRRLPTRLSFVGVRTVTWTHRFHVGDVRDRYRATGVGDLITDRVVGDANRLLEGEYPMYGADWKRVGWPPSWLVNPTTGVSYPAIHWTGIPDDDATQGDIKDVWELSRFGSTFLLARAHALTGDDRFAEAWWRAVESWAAANPPNSGVNWRCGQETSLRAIAWCFGLSTFGDHASSTPTRMALAGQLLGASLERVRPTIGYALSQRNNHAISELAFLLALPGVPSRRLSRLLREALDDQFFDDGSYGQQSMVYERLALHVLCWLLAVQPRLHRGLRDEIESTLGRGAALLERCTDPVGGELANYGPNDGSNLLQFTMAAPLDARPTLALLGRPTEHLASREPTLWFAADEAPAAKRSDSTESTYKTMHGPRSLLLTRVGALTRRPADADQQAVELFINGERLVIDPGTFRYSGRAPWRNPFISADVHSTIRSTVFSDSLAVGRFLRASMQPATVVVEVTQDDTDILVSCRAEGTSRLTRVVVRRLDSYAVLDLVEGDEARVRWNLCPGEIVAEARHRLEMATERNCLIFEAPVVRRLRRSDDHPASGWWSPSYGLLAVSEALESTLAAGQTALARFAPSPADHISKSDLARIIGQHVNRPIGILGGS